MLTLWLSGPAVEYAGRRSDEELKDEITVHLRYGIPIAFIDCFFRNALKNDSIEHPSRIMRYASDALLLVFLLIMIFVNSSQHFLVDTVGRMTLWSLDPTLISLQKP